MKTYHLVLFIDYIAKNEGEKVNYNYVLRAAKDNVLPDFINSEVVTLDRHPHLIKLCKEKALQYFALDEKQVHTFTIMDFCLSHNF